MTLSKRQREVIDLMGEGWGLFSDAETGRSYLKENRDGIRHHYNFPQVIDGLLDKGLVKFEDWNKNITTYKLTDKAKGL